MANLYLTHKCRRNCPFCFARKVLAEAGSNVNEILEIDDIKKYLAHFNQTKEPIGLLGGEPFLYPHLAELMQLLKEDGRMAKIFTSATDPVPQALLDIDPAEHRERLSFIVNVGTRDTYTDVKYANLVNFFKHFASVASLSYTIFDLNADPGYLFELIETFHLLPIIRVGIALPIYNGGNQYIPLEDYKKAGEYFVSLAEKAAERGIVLGMDCGFTACMFTDAQIGRLERLGCMYHFVCGVAMDVGPGLKVWNCFPLFQLGRVDALDYKDMNEMRQALNKQNEKMLGELNGVLPECKNCHLFHTGLCEGGCKSFKSIELSHPHN